MKNSNSQLTQWALAVQPYCSTMAHGKGAANGNADGLSRGALGYEQEDANDDSPKETLTAIVRGKGCDGVC